MKIFYNYLNEKFIPFIIYSIVSIITLTLKISFINKEAIKKIKDQNKSIIYASFHGDNFFMIPAHKNKNIVVLTSLSKDGELLSNILKKFNYLIVRGSSSKGGFQALRNLTRIIRQGKDCAFAVDGPKGPIYKIKPGALFLAQLSNSLILPVVSYTNNKKTFEKSWDKYELPFPFSKTVIIYGEPFEVLKEDNLELKGKELEKIMLDLKEKAKNIIK